MIRKIVVLLVIGFAIALAPAAAAEEISSDGSGGDCVWTSSSGSQPGGGVNARKCLDQSSGD